MVANPVPTVRETNNMSSDCEALELIGDIYDCIIDPSRWPATLERTARWVGLSAVGINVKNPARREVTFLRAWGGNSKYRQLYRDTYFALNPAMTAGWFVGLHEPVTCSGFAGLSEWLSCRMYREWMKPQSYLDACGLNLTKDATHHAMLSVIRSEDRGWFTDEEFDKLRRAQPSFSASDIDRRSSRSSIPSYGRARSNPRPLERRRRAR